MLQIPCNWTSEVLSRRAGHGCKLVPGLGDVDAEDEGNALAEREIGPVDAIGRVAVVGPQGGREGLQGHSIVWRGQERGGPAVAAWGGVRHGGGKVRLTGRGRSGTDGEQTNEGQARIYVSTSRQTHRQDRTGE
jgi:hypothetical protein